MVTASRPVALDSKRLVDPGFIRGAELQRLVGPVKVQQPIAHIRLDCTYNVFNRAVNVRGDRGQRHDLLRDEAHHAVQVHADPVQLVLHPRAIVCAIMLFNGRAHDGCVHLRDSLWALGSHCAEHATHALHSVLATSLRPALGSKHSKLLGKRRGEAKVALKARAQLVAEPFDRLTWSEAQLERPVVDGRIVQADVSRQVDFAPEVGGAA